MKSSRVSTHFPSGCFETCPSFRPPTTPRLPPLRQAQLLYCDIFPTLELFLCPSPFERISAVHGSKLLLPVVGSSEGFGQEVQRCHFESRPSRTTTATGATFTPTPTASTLVSIAAETTASPILAPPHHSNSSRPSLWAGPIAGIVIGAVAVVALASALLYMCGRRQSVKEILQHQATAQPQNQNSYQPAVGGIS
ncbi:hypothetical protein BKA61DRAFT_13981 [Leptodontidium sp. MPI-SDFR-AT-0119]|nr:hypothetical protein BKA61DRAFT_13981 [Leptodontidium sp. MPI-SDFR-AT-0119]